MNELLKNLKSPDCYILANLSHETPKENGEIIQNKYLNLISKINTNNTENDIDLDSQDFIKFKKKYLNDLKTKINKQIDNSIIKCNSESIIILGLPGAGKSSIIETLKGKQRAFHVDFDNIKSTVAKEFNISINSGQISKAAQKITNELLNYLQHKKINYIQEKIGNDIESIEKMVSNLKLRNYNISLELVQISNETSRMRNIERCEKLISNGMIPRIVPDNDIKNFGNSPLNTYLSIIQKNPNLFKSCSCRTTDREYQTNGNPKDSFEIVGIKYENGKSTANKDYYKLGSQIKEFGRKTIANLILEFYENQDKQLYNSINNWNNIYFNQNIKIPDSISEKDTKIRKLIEDITENLMLDTFQIYGNECINKNAKPKEFNFDTKKLEKRIEKIINEKYNSKILSNNLTKLNEEFEKEQKLKENTQQRLTKINDLDNKEIIQDKI